jgi:hypothetical protein
MPQPARRLRLGVAPAGAPREPVDALHRERLELLGGILRCALELEAPCDLAAAPGGRALNESIFFAHFEEWADLLREWDELQLRSRSAPGELWARAARACEQWRLAEPPLALGAVVDKLAILTLQRAREWQLDTPRELAAQLVTDRVGGRDQLTLYLERERVARAAGDPAQAEEALNATARALQAIFDELQRSPEARTISATRDGLLELKHELLSRIGALRLDAASFAAECPLCAAGPGASMQAA